MISNISRIFWDLDQTLVDNHEVYHFQPFNPTDGWDFELYWPEEKEKYFTSVRPAAKRLIEFSRSMVGKENVFILTAACRDVALRVNHLAKFGFSLSNIYSYESWGHWCKYYALNEPFKFEDTRNILIDNEAPSDTKAFKKRMFLGIDKFDTSHRYLQVSEYLGNPSNVKKEREFEESVKKFILSFI